MDEQELERRVKAFVADMQGKGIDPRMALAVLGQGSTAEKTADARGVAYKAADAPVAPTEITINGQVYALKAPLPGAEMIAAGVTEAADGLERAGDAATDETAAEDEEYLLSDAEIDRIAGAVVARLMAELSGIQAAVATMEETAKQYGFARKEQSDLKARVDALGQQLAIFTAVVKEFTDDLPAGGHRASQAAETVVRPDDALATIAAKNAQAQQAAGPRSVLDQIADSLPAAIGGAGIPWPFDVAPPQGVNVQQHQAPGT